MKKLLFGLAVLMAFISCGRQIVSEELVEADSLIAAEKNDSAYQLLSGIDERKLVNDEDKAHYYLLMTRACILTGNTVPHDSCLNRSISYYKQQKDYYQLADAYYYKAYSLFQRQDISEAMLLLKEAEKQSVSSQDIKQQFKIAELIAHLNNTVGNNNLFLKYARHSLKLAELLNDNNRQAYSLLKISHAFRVEGQNDSANYYTLKIIPLLDDVTQKDRAYFLTDIGYAFKYSDPEKAKEYFSKALEQQEYTHTLAHLADIYNKEGNRDEAYRLWKRALAVNDGAPKQIVMYNILEYDIQHGKTDDVLAKVNDIIDSFDSIRTNLRNDTLKDMQLRFDHEVEKYELDRKLDRSIIAIVALIALVIVIVSYVIIKRHKHRLFLAKTQIQIDNYTAQIHRLEESGNDVKEEVDQLKAKINEMAASGTYRVNRGMLLYNEIKNDGNMVEWSKDDYEMFINYYDAVDHSTVKILRDCHKNITPRNLSFLLLYEMGKNDDDIRRIMALSPEGLRSMRFRVKHDNDKK